MLFYFLRRHRPVHSAFRWLRSALPGAALFPLVFAQQPARSQIPNAAPLDEAHRHATQGISLAKGGNLPQAEEELQQAVHLAPRVAQYRAQLASILGLEGKWKPALETFQKAIDLAPENLDFRREAAAVQWQLGLMPAAERNLEYVLTRRPQDPGSNLLLGLVKERTGDYRKAAELLDAQFAMVTAQPDRVVAMFHSVIESRQSEKIAKIVDVLQRHANEKEWTDAISRCARLAAMAGDLQTTNALFVLIPGSDPARAPAALQMAKLLYDNGRISDARQLLLQLDEQGVVSADLQALLGNCYESERQPDLALQAYQRAIQTDTKRVDYYEDLISLLLYLHKTDEALVQVQQALTAAPNDARVWVWKGNVHLRRNSPQEAMESYQHAVQLDRSNPDAVLGVATVYFATGQSERAITEYKLGISRFPNDSRFYVACAEMLVTSPDSPRTRPEAERLLIKAVKLAPRSSEAHYLLGQLAVQQSRWKDAESEFLLSLDSDPDRSKTHFALSGVYRRMGRTEDAMNEFTIYERLKRAEEGGEASAGPTEPQ